MSAKGNEVAAIVIHEFLQQQDLLKNSTSVKASSLSDLKNRSENLAGRGHILTILQVNSRSIDQKKR